MKFMAILTLLVFCSGCGWFGREWAKTTGKAESCIDGVVYIQFASGVSVKYNRDGSIKNCN